MSGRSLQLGVSLLANDPTESASEAESARLAGFDHVFVIDRLNNDTGAEADLVVEFSYRLLSMASKSSTTVAISPFLGEDGVADRVRLAREKLCSVQRGVRLAFSFLQVSIDDPADLTVLRRLVPAATERELREMATLLNGSTSAAVERIRRFHHDLGITYFTFHKSAATTWRTLAAVAAAVR